MAYIEKEVERSVPELKIGNLLSNAEIRQIIKERTFYADRKFKFSKHNFLRYIQFENKLFRLSMLRAQTTKNLRKNDIDSIRKLFISRINSIYNMALSRYSSDKQLWLLSFDFAKRYSERISRAKFLKALLLHPNWVNAWIEAAKYEFEWNKNPTNARLLYQRAISLNKKSFSLYLCFFQMEIAVIKQHLNWNYNEIEQTNKNFNWKKELNVFNETNSEKDKDQWVQRIYSQMELPKLIFRYAMKYIKGKLKYVLIKRMLLLIPTKKELINNEINEELDEDELNNKYNDIINRFEQLKKYMFEYLEKHFYFDAVIIQLLARKNLQIYSKNNKVLNRSVEIAGAQVFERAVLLLECMSNKSKKNKKLTTGQKNKYIINILNYFVKYLQNRMEFYIDFKKKIIAKRNNKNEQELNENELYLLKLYSNVMNYLVLRLLYAFKKLLELNAMTPIMFKDWINTLTQMDKFAEALNIIQLATKQYSNSILLWKLYSDLYCRQLCICDENERDNYYRMAIAANVKGIELIIDGKEKELLWINMIDIIIAQLTYLCMNNSNEMIESKENESESDSDSDCDMNDMNVLIGKQIDIINKTFRKGICECLGNNNGLKEYYLKWMVGYYNNNRKKQLETLKWFDRNTMKCSVEIYRIMFDIYEMILLFDIENVNQLNYENKMNVEMIGKLYEKCLSEHGEIEAQVWIWCVEFSRKYRKAVVASSVYQRALKTLDSDGLQVFLQNVNMKQKLI